MGWHFVGWFGWKFCGKNYVKPKKQHLSQNYAIEQKWARLAILVIKIILPKNVILMIKV